MLSSELRAAADELIDRYPLPRSALLPLLHLVQAQDGYVGEDGISECADLVGLTRADVRAVALAFGRGLGWETAADVRGEAAPVMAASHRPLDRLPAPSARVETPAEPPSGHENEFDAVVIDWLLDRGIMLVGAKELAVTGRPAAVWVNHDDARWFAISDGQPLTVTGPGAG